MSEPSPTPEVLCDPRYELVWTEALRALSQQQSLLESIRSRTGTLLSAAAISTSFLGGVAFDDGEVAGAGILASVLFGMTAALGVWILMPRPGWKWANTPQQLLDEYVEGDEPLGHERMLRDLSLHMNENLTENKTKMHWLMGEYSLASGLLAVSISCWLVELV
jgi:hypothetical protein